LKILYLDIETSPNLGYVWQLWNQNVGLKQLHKQDDMLCFAALWDHEPDSQTQFYSQWADGEEGMVRKAWELLNECDILVTYNGKKFDTPWLQRKFWENGLTPPKPFKQVDLCAVVKREFNFPSNKLMYISEHMLGTKHSKISVDFELWLGVMRGHRKDQVLMERYCKKDTKILRPLHNKLLPWIRVYPSHAGFTGEIVCPNCGKGPLVKQGFKHTQTRKYQQFQCRACGSWSRDTHCVPGSSVSITSGENS
jgi:DNA polymerase elongation subunit (family B)